MVYGHGGQGDLRESRWREVGKKPLSPPTVFKNTQRGIAAIEYDFLAGSLEFWDARMRKVPLAFKKVYMNFSYPA